MPHCETELKPKAKLPFCHLCRSAFYRWSIRTPKEIMERRRKLSLYSDRINKVLRAVNNERPNKSGK